MAAAPSRASLLAMFGPKRGLSKILQGSVTIGRGAQAELQLVDDKVSRAHCRLEPVAGGYHVVDLGSRNGTWVNGQRLSGPVLLKAEDQLGVGESVLIFAPSFEVLRGAETDATLLLSSSHSRGIEELPPAAADTVLLHALEKVHGAATPHAAARALAACTRSLFNAAQVVVLEQHAFAKPCAAAPETAVIALPKALLEHAAHTRNACMTAEVQREAVAAEHVTQVRSGEAALLCCALRKHGELWGWLVAMRRQPFSGDEAARFAAVGLLCGSALAQTVKPPRPVVPKRLVAESMAMKQAVAQALAAARTSSTVLITGETGTGKEELARLIHANSPRAAGPFVALNCGAVSATLAESEFFGHERGAFTGAVTLRRGVFEQAHGGTLFLDEIAELEPSLQVKLLRALQERIITRVGGARPLSVDFRLVAATHRALSDEMGRGAFREDLYWRLNVVPLSLPPLRERQADIRPLVETLLLELCQRMEISVPPVDAAVFTTLEGVAWPGNVRQLRNVLERALVLKGSAAAVSVADLPPDAFEGSVGLVSSKGTLGERIAALEREHIGRALRQARGIKVAAATALGISRPTLDRKIAEHRIDVFATPAD
ncbi:MAG: sigma 54-interacting transcriptional regulator [Myxococcaceae bacterium]|nr:sigma 54-interacting transcriptional regulator [Myxococcaceae bacterium]